jgi:hypothetical protein
MRGATIYEDMIESHEKEHDTGIETGGIDASRRVHGRASLDMDRGDMASDVFIQNSIMHQVQYHI